MSKVKVLVEHTALRRFTQSVFTRVGVPDADAELVADTIVEADLRGVNTHGVMRLPIYVKRITAGVVNPITNLRVIARSPAGWLLDGQNGLGQVISRQAMTMAVDIAAQQGVAVITVRNSNHAGVAGLYAEQAATAGMIGLYTTNAAPSIAPTGGIKPMLGSNPVAVGIPTGGSYPVVLDFASTVVARANLLLAKMEGRSIPLGWALDPQGNPTEDPEAGLRGSMLPIGAHKGYGIALVADVLSGVLSGGLCGPWIPPMYGDFKRPQGIGHFLMVVNVEAFLPIEQFRKQMDRLVMALKRCEKGEGVKEVFVPGEIEFRRRERAIQEGVTISSGVVKELRVLGQQFGISVPF